MPSTTSRSARNSRLRRVQFASGVNGAPNLPSRSVWLISQSRNRGRCPARIEARARLLTSAILTPAGQAVVHQPQPEHQSTVRSGVCTCRPSRLIGTGAARRKRWACGPTYFGPGNRSSTRATGHTSLQMLHLRHSSVDSPTVSWRASSTTAAIVIARPPPCARARFGFDGPPLRDAAARQALASATPSPQRSTITRWPASSPPTTRTLSKSGPSLGQAGSIGRSASSVRRPADAIGSEPGSSGSPASHCPIGGPSTGNPRMVSRMSPSGSPTSPPPATPPVARTSAPTRVTSSRVAAAVAIAVTIRPVVSTLATRSPIRIRPPRARSAVLSTSCRRMPGIPGGTSGTSITGAPSRSTASARTSGWRRRPRTAGNATRNGPRPVAATAWAVSSSAAARHDGSSKASAIRSALRFRRSARPGQSGATPSTRAGPPSPPHTSGRLRLPATARGQKSLNPAWPATTSRSPGPHGWSAAAWDSGTIETGRIPPIPVGSAPYGASSEPAYGSPPAATRASNHSSAGATSAPSTAYGCRFVRSRARSASVGTRRARRIRDVDGAAGPMERAVALREDHHAGAGIGQPDRGREARQAGADDRDVSAWHRCRRRPSRPGCRARASPSGSLR